MASMANTEDSIAAGIALPADWRDFVALTKPRVMSLVVFTGLCGLLAAPGAIHPIIGFTAILCIAFGAGGAAALNQWYEADLDAHCKSSGLANFRRPRAYVFVDEIPKSPVGKLLRRKLVAGEYDREKAAPASGDTKPS